MLKGCDVSLWEGRGIDWEAAKAAGLGWVSVKVSEGRTITDPCAVHNVAGALAAGLPVMPYHYLLPSSSAEAQWERFHASIEACGGWDGLLAPALDVEGDDHNSLPNMSGQDYANLARNWLALMEAETKQKGVVYTYPSFNSENGIGGVLGAHSYLWAASYGDHAPVFAGWDHCSFWQYTSSGSFPGIPNDNGLDLDWFLGSADDLASLLVVKPKELKVVLPDGTVCACEPRWVGERITVKAEPLLAALGLPQNNPAVHVGTGRAFVGAPDGLADNCPGWEFVYRSPAQGPRVYCKRVKGAVRA